MRSKQSAVFLGFLFLIILLAVIFNTEFGFSQASCGDGFCSFSAGESCGNCVADCSICPISTDDGTDIISVGALPILVAPGNITTISGLIEGSGILKISGCNVVVGDFDPHTWSEKTVSSARYSLDDGSPLSFTGNLTLLESGVDHSNCMYYSDPNHINTHKNYLYSFSFDVDTTGLLPGTHTVDVEAFSGFYKSINGVIFTVVSSCGNDICDPWEDSVSCLVDCQPQLCGDGFVDTDTGEQCDPGPPLNLSGETCQSRGFTSGTLSCTGSCTFDESGCSSFNNPKGTHDTSTCTSFTGWTCDADDYNQPLNVEFYADGLKGSGGNYTGSVLADQARNQTVADQCGGNPNHGFTFNTPDNLKDWANHSIYAYGINTGLGNDTLLSNSPQTINCAPPPTCTITSAEWSVTGEVVEGTVVEMIVQGSGCDGKNMDFEIYENDPVFDDLVITISGTFDRESLTTFWTYSGDDDQGEDARDYYFKAILLGTGEFQESSNLAVTKIIPPPCSGINRCVDYTDQQSCNLDDCNVAEDSIPIDIDCDAPNIDCSGCFWNSTDNLCGPSYNVTDPGSCGDGVRDTGEVCDGTDFGGYTCSDFDEFTGGTLSCNSNCDGFVTSQCDVYSCNNDGSRDTGKEACDGIDLGGYTCLNFDEFTGGTLLCNSVCDFDTSQCTGGPGVSKIGQCIIYNEQTSDTCDDGFLSFSWIATWVWDLGCDDPCQAANPDKAAQCIDGQKTVECPAQIPLPFFGFYNVIVALILISLIYWVLTLRKEKPDKK